MEPRRSFVEPVRESAELVASGDTGGNYSQLGRYNQPLVPSEAILLNPEQVPLAGVSAALDDLGGEWAQVSAAMSQWSSSTRPNPGLTRAGGLMDRDRYLAPEGYFNTVRMCRSAVEEDDVLGGAADGTESLACAKVQGRSRDLAEEDMWNQWLADINMDSVVRTAWRNLYTDSAFVIGTIWGNREFKVRSRTENGNKSRKKFNVRVPTEITFLDATRVTPVGTTLFGREKLAYVATPTEAGLLDQMLGPKPGGPDFMPLVDRPRNRLITRTGVYQPPSQFQEDDITKALIVSRYEPPLLERQELSALGVDCTNLFLLNDRNVHRHTLTRSSHQKFPDVRLRSCLGLLDLKNALRQMDRAHLMGATYFIVLITKGSEKEPATQAELQNLRANASNIAQTPIVVGDYRLNIEIITPKTDYVLDKDKHDTVNSGLFARAWGSFVPTGTDQNDPIKLGQVIAQGLQSRRHMMRRAFEQFLFEEIRSRNSDAIEERGTLRFSPERIALNFDRAFASFLLDLRQARETSRDTTLSQIGLSQENEALMREREAEMYDETFGTINPYGQNPDQDGGDSGDEDTTRVDRRSGGRQRGGTRNGGGSSPGSGQGDQTPQRERTRSGGGRREAMKVRSMADVEAALDEVTYRSVRGWAQDLEIPGRSKQTTVTGLSQLVASYYEDHPEAFDEDEDE